MILFNPNKRSRQYQDDKTDKLMRATIDFFESKGLRQIKHDWHERKWNHDYVDFLKEQQVFATLMAPAGYGAADSRWDSCRNCELISSRGRLSYSRNS